MADGFSTNWRVENDPVDYVYAVRWMENRVAGILDGTMGETVWLVEHPPLYTAGTRARPADLIDPGRFPVHHTGRGGEFTYHGPGQRVCYVMMDLRRRGQDIRRYIHDLENWMILALDELGVAGMRRPGRVGIWVDAPTKGGVPGRERKIAAIGVRIRRWVTYHGISLNVNPDLSHYDGIVPCGLSAFGVTSLSDLGLDITMPDVDAVLHRTFLRVFSTEGQQAMDFGPC